MSDSVAQVFPVTAIDKPFENKFKDPSGSGMSLVGITLAAVPAGHSLVNLAPYFDAYRLAPRKREGHLNLDFESFIRFVNRYKNAQTTVMFYKKKITGKFALTAIFDYHPQGPVLSDTGAGGFRASTVVDGEELNIAIRNIALETFKGDTP